jgi:tRNA 2-selenouridine synthase
VTVQIIPADEAIARLGSFSTIIDARSENEFAEDHLPGAVNWPSLNNEERHQIGTLYKQVSPFEAKKRGAALVAANVARHIERDVLDKPKGWQPLVYCWRGGKRSGSLALILDQIGFRVHLVDGGYKAFRSAVLAQLPALAQSLQYRVVCGPTGSGKTRLLQALAAAGAQVLDLGGWPTTAARSSGWCRGKCNRRRSATTAWCGSSCAALTRRARCMWKARARRLATLPCPRH